MVDVIPDGTSIVEIGIMFVTVPVARVVVGLIPDGTAIPIGMIGVGMAAELILIQDGTAVIAGGTVVTEFTEASVTEVILDGSTAMVIVVEVAVVSEVTKFSPDGKSVISTPASPGELAPLSAVTLGIRISESAEVATHVIAVSLSSWDPAWKSTVMGLPASGEDATFLEERSLQVLMFKISGYSITI